MQFEPQRSFLIAFLGASAIFADASVGGLIRCLRGAPLHITLLIISKSKVTVLHKFSRNRAKRYCNILSAKALLNFFKTCLFLIVLWLYFMKRKISCPFFLVGAYGSMVLVFVI